VRKSNDDPEKEMRLMAQMATTTPSTNGKAPLSRQGGERFSFFAAPPPSKKNLLSAPQPDSNIYGQLR
jgi:hypothetical protein